MDARLSRSAVRAGASGCRPDRGDAIRQAPAIVQAPARAARPDRIKKRADFLAAARAASAAAPGFVLQARKRPESHPVDGAQVRLGLTASKKVGGAVVRSRAKRRLRAIGDAVLSELGRPGWDYVLIARAERTVSRDFATMRTELQTAVTRAHAGGGARGDGSRRRPRSRSPDVR